ncbi:MAG TPA: alpha/beta fold hydrolase [Propionibacteriaceae bacterium]|nr:alpha/beta fold hydrolase [Propionibacteriaceae bacterium]
MTEVTASSGIHLHVTEIGADRPGIVFCHGLFGQGRNWTTIAKGLSPDYTSLLVDLPNHGRSSWTDAFSYREMARAVADVIDARTDGSPVALVGHSMGGKVAMTVALQHPEIVERLGVVDIAPVRYPGPSSFTGYVEAMRALDLAKLSTRSEADDQLASGVSDPRVRSFLLQNLRREGDGWQWQMNLRLLGDHLTELGDFPELEAAPYRGPVLWIGGARSDYVTTEYAHAMRRLFPRVVTVTVKGAGHWVHSEQPEVFVGILRRFLAEGPGAS